VAAEEGEAAEGGAVKLQCRAAAAGEATGAADLAMNAIFPSCRTSVWSLFPHQASRR
jgi:hypothetical protein